jgi:hypothetical protein
VHGVVLLPIFAADLLIVLGLIGLVKKFCSPTGPADEDE